MLVVRVKPMNDAIVPFSSEKTSPLNEPRLKVSVERKFQAIVVFERSTL